MVFGCVSPSFCTGRKTFKNAFFQRIPQVAASERLNADEAAPLCSVAVGKENIRGKA